MKLLYIINVILICFMVTGCGEGKKTETERTPVKKTREMAAKPARIPTKYETPKYEYLGIKFRDPFIPLNEEGVKIKIVSEGTHEIDPASLSLTGILIDKDDRIASLNDSSGNSYIVRNKRLFNDKREMIDGIVGIVKLESVVIITKDKTVRELKLRTEDEY